MARRPPYKAFFKKILHYYGHLKSKLLLRKLDNPSFVAPKEPGFRLFMHVRNEAHALPFFLKYYRALGVTEFFVVDNGSDDQTVALLMRQPDVRLFRTKESFSKSKQGSRWNNILISRYAANEWCLVADADEILVFPHSDFINLRDLCAYLDTEKKTCLKSFFVDMYAKGPVCEHNYQVGESFLKFFPHFDRIHYSQGNGYYGGTQLRMISRQKAIWKTSLVRHTPALRIAPGNHVHENATASALHGTVLHFPYRADFKRRCEEESVREEYANKSNRYKSYLEEFNRDPKLSFFHSESQTFVNVKQLRDLGMMISTNEFDHFAEAIKKKGRFSRTASYQVLTVH